MNSKNSPCSPDLAFRKVPEPNRVRRLTCRCCPCGVENASLLYVGAESERHLVEGPPQHGAAEEVTEALLDQGGRRPPVLLQRRMERHLQPVLAASPDALDPPLRPACAHVMGFG
nr:unnamed protein product [Digitaria exilis]